MAQNSAGLITLIKLMRTCTGMGLVEAKNAVERFLEMYNQSKEKQITDFEILFAFAVYCGLFSSKQIRIETNGCIYLTEYSPLSDNQITEMIRCRR